jgi:FdhD protein
MILSEMSRSAIRVRKQKVKGNSVLEAEDDWLAIEEPLQIVLYYYRGEKQVERQLAMTMRTPGFDTELVAGFLFSEGIIHCREDIEGIDASGTKVSPAITVQLRRGIVVDSKQLKRSFSLSSSCGVCGKTTTESLGIPSTLRLEDGFEVDLELIHQLPERMRIVQETFAKTGGLHASALFDSQGEIICAHEDIGRHNALDKVVGEQLLNGGLPCSEKILCVSGRMSYDIIQKALMAQMSIVVGVGAPSSLAVALANDFNLTLIGFVRNGSYSVYSSPQRLSVE